LLSGAHAGFGRTAILVDARRLRKAAITTDPAGVAAVLNALRGGAGHEWVTLINRELRDLPAVIRGFVAGRYVQYSIPGLVAKTPNAQPLYEGPGLDRMFLTEAGVLLGKGGVMEFGAITRGPYFRNSATSELVFGINRGKGAMLGAPFASRPNITPDAIVTITVGPYGHGNSGTITDLVTGATQSIDPRKIFVAGPTVRVFLNASELPSEGYSVNHYRFASWTRIVEYGGITYSDGIASVGSFAPESSMIPIGVLKNVKLHP
jgi:hypothetical protein